MIIVAGIQLATEIKQLKQALVALYAHKLHLFEFNKSRTFSDLFKLILQLKIMSSGFPSKIIFL